MTSGRPEITLDPRRIRVLFGGHDVADSDQALLVREAGEQPTLYFPRKDVEMTILARTGLNALSPTKGVSTHFTIYRDATVVENAAWSFEDPPAPFALIAGHIVFHPVHFELAAHDETPADWKLEAVAPAPSQTPNAISFASADDLATALQRAAAAHHLDEARTGATDPDWPRWYAAYIAAEQAAGRDPVQA
ncbi:MAG: DUF427 domain-containing protein [Phenylobacterium sp.]|uniref:DUF427 domain-containing protein n=1 Tax=Phenylobacterium sp. TaxID=1871053 RepID=UPI00120D1A46|nr:DUF427 domain-containing protein [Phenylobacterium sp.]TAJ72411.1 MAG: DUF427 domain-containing protein [Phenylobacterium sp.]